ncbi:helix-turn-helix transcriptional regulator [Virgibacillus salexigens]|uniref:helix-turn-helix transcriptional regulator n=1 Tax=Virgibacillus salexigens TaxID=61016 RepID=UPI00190DEAF0|nr:helix-turn-helix domain-containing protein [Virgibacillus salexigens]
MQCKLAGIRKYNNLTQKDMADLIGVELRTYVNKEKGVSQFKLNEMFIISRKFGKSIEEIFLFENFM